MDLIVSTRAAFQTLTDTFSQFEDRIKELEAEVRLVGNKLTKTEKALQSCESELKEVKGRVISLAHEAGMTSNDTIFHNAALFIGRNLKELSSIKIESERLGYVSLKSMFKAVKMTTAETRNKKTRSYFEEVLPQELIDLPIGLQLTSCLSDVKLIENLLIKKVYPTFEVYVQSLQVDMKKLLSMWENVNSSDDLNDIKNWCVERMHGVSEQTSEDLISLEELTSKNITLSGAYNSQIRQGLLDWVIEEEVSAVRREFEKDWEPLAPNSIIHKLLKKYAGCPMHSSVKEAAKELGYLSFSGEWSEKLTLDEIASAMKATDSIKETAKWNTDFVDIAIEAIQKCEKGKTDLIPFTECVSTLK